jgi:hypothetical protein
MTHRVYRVHGYPVVKDPLSRPLAISPLEAVSSSA